MKGDLREKKEYRALNSQAFGKVPKGGLLRVVVWGTDSNLLL